MTREEDAYDHADDINSWAARRWKSAAVGTPDQEDE